MRFPYPAGSYGPNDVVVVDGKPRVVAFDPELSAWLTERGIDVHDTYRVTTCPTGVWVHRFARDDQGQFRLNRRRTDVARRLPKLVRR